MVIKIIGGKRMKIDQEIEILNLHNLFATQNFRICGDLCRGPQYPDKRVGKSLIKIKKMNPDWSKNKRINKLAIEYKSLGNLAKIYLNDYDTLMKLSKERNDTEQITPSKAEQTKVLSQKDELEAFIYTQDIELLRFKAQVLNRRYKNVEAELSDELRAMSCFVKAIGEKGSNIDKETLERGIEMLSQFNEEITNRSMETNREIGSLGKEVFELSEQAEQFQKEDNKEAKKTNYRILMLHKKQELLHEEIQRYTTKASAFHDLKGDFRQEHRMQ